MDYDIVTDHGNEALKMITIVDHVEYFNDFLREQSVRHFKFHNKEELRQAFIDHITKGKKDKSMNLEKISIEDFFDTLDSIVTHHRFMARSKATKMIYKNSRKHRGMGSIIKHTKNPGVNNEKMIPIVKLGSGITGFDTSGDGIVDALDTNRDGIIDTKLLDTTGDGVLDTTVILESGKTSVVS